MYENIKALLNNWNATTTERQKLQHTYLVISIAMVFVAGIISLLNTEIGHEIVLIALFAVMVFLANAVIWNLLNSALLTKLSSRSKKK